jgi:hypothetical protein
LHDKVRARLNKHDHISYSVKIKGIIQGLRFDPIKVVFEKVLRRVNILACKFNADLKEQCQVDWFRKHYESRYQDDLQRSHCSPKLLHSDCHQAHQQEASNLEAFHCFGSDFGKFGYCLSHGLIINLCWYWSNEKWLIISKRLVG